MAFNATHSGSHVDAHDVGFGPIPINGGSSQAAKMPLATDASCVRVLRSESLELLPVQSSFLLMHTLGAAGEGSGSWVSAIHVLDLD